MIEAAVYRQIQKTKIGGSSDSWSQEEIDTLNKRDIAAKAQREAEDLKLKTEQPNAYRMKKFLDIAQSAGVALGFVGGPLAVFQTAGLGMAPIIGAGAALAISPVLGVVAGVAGLSAVAYGLAKGIEYFKGEENSFSLPSKEETLLKIKDVTKEITDYSTDLIQPKRKIQP